MLLINDKYRIYDISMADMLKSLLSKSSQDDTFPFTRETMANFEIARISSMHHINFTYTTAYLLFSSVRSDKYCEWIVNQYVIFCENDCMMLGNESTRNKINKIKPYYIFVLILHSCLLSMWYVLFITKWDIRKRENFFKFYTVTIWYNGTQISWFCKFLEKFTI